MDIETATDNPDGAPLATGRHAPDGPKRARPSRRLHCVGVALLALSAAAPAAAQTTQGIIQVSLQVERGCLLAEVPGTGPVELGRVDFGSHARLDEGHAPTAQLDLSVRPLLAGTRLECNPGTAFRFEVDGGLHGGSGELRHLRLQPDASHPRPSATIPYRLYRDAARRLPLPANAAIHGITPDDGRVDLRLYAQVEPSADAPPVGHYRDVLHVTVSW